MKMILQADLVAKFVLALFCIFVLGKAISVLLQNLTKGLWPGKEGRRGASESDFDRMVQRKKRELALSSPSAPKGIKATSPPATRSSPPLSPTAEAYRNWFEGPSRSQDPAIPQAKAALEMLSHLEWGEGPHYKKVQELLRAQAGPSVGMDLVHSTFKAMVGKNTLLRLKAASGNAWPAPYEDMLRAVAGLCGLQSLALGLGGDDGDPNIQKALAAWATSSVDREGRPVSIERFFKLLDGSPGQVRASLPQGSERAVSAWQDWCISPSKERFLDWHQIVAQLQKSAETFESLAPIPEVEGHDRNGALQVLGLAEDVSWEMIKKSFKGLAAQRHPDKFQGLGPDPRPIERATANFMRLQSAYETLKKFYKE